jgi:hypothetical protein
MSAKKSKATERDIVERLRDPMVESYGDRLEAANAIEHLRDALKDILQAREDEPNDFRCITKVLPIASTALARG